jgi:hypothetical protein
MVVRPHSGPIFYLCDFDIQLEMLNLLRFCERSRGLIGDEMGVGIEIQVLSTNLCCFRSISRNLGSTVYLRLLPPEVLSYFPYFQLEGRAVFLYVKNSAI